MTTGRINQVAAFRDPGPDSLLFAEESSRPEAAQPRTSRCGDLASCSTRRPGSWEHPGPPGRRLSEAPLKPFPWSASTTRSRCPRGLLRSETGSRGRDLVAGLLPADRPESIDTMKRPGSIAHRTSSHRLAMQALSSVVDHDRGDCSRTDPDLGSARLRFPSRGACAGRWLQLPFAPHRSRLSLTVHSWARALSTAVRHVGPDSRD